MYVNKLREYEFFEGFVYELKMSFYMVYVWMVDNYEYWIILESMGDGV